jgi:TPR repeat protein
MTNVLIDDHQLLDLEQDELRLHEAKNRLATNFPQAKAELEDLADHGSVMAMLYLAHAFSERGEAGYVEAEKWYRMAYERNSSTALFSLAKLNYLRGNISEAEKIWTYGASKNDSPSMFWLASIYLDNLSDTAKRAQAKPLLENASALGQLRATYRLGRILLTGEYGLTKIPRGLLLCLKFLISGVRVAYRDPTSRRLW